MIALLMVLFLLVCFALAVVVLLQAGKGGGLAAGFGGSGTGFEMLGGRQTATLLHQSTRWLGGAFLVIAFLIALLTARTNRPGSLLQRELEGEPQPAGQEAGAPRDLESVVGPRAGAAAEAGDAAAGPASSQPEQAPAGATNAPAAAPGAAPAPRREAPAGASTGQTPAAGDAGQQPAPPSPR